MENTRFEKDIKKLEKIPLDQQMSEFNLTTDMDRLFTTLILDDYDWMHYIFETKFPTKKQGFLDIQVEYYGTTTSNMNIIQILDDKEYSHTFSFDTEIFIRFLKAYMHQHIAQWDDDYAFCGEQMAVELFNEILDNHIGYDAFGSGVSG